jgi:uncharacterized protein YndB with AHSA1/START domain
VDTRSIREEAWMIAIESRTQVGGIRAREVTEFLLRCDDAAYRRWWPGTHLHFRTLSQRPGEVGNTVYMDEWVGARRLRMTAVVTAVSPGERIVWQLKALVRQPVRLLIAAEDIAGGVQITHTIRAGFTGLGAVLDPLFRLYFSRDFELAMDAHMKDEFQRLGALLQGGAR